MLGHAPLGVLALGQLSSPAAAGDAVAPGALLPLTLSLIAGAASGEGQITLPPVFGRAAAYSGTAPGAHLDLWVSLLPGRATGFVDRRQDATARGAVVAFRATLAAGSATGDAVGYDNDLMMLLAA